MNKSRKIFNKLTSFTLAFLIFLSSLPLNIVAAEGETVSETVNETINETKRETLKETIEESIKETADETKKETIKESNEETVDETVKETSEETIVDTVEETNEETKESLILEKLEFEDLNSRIKTNDLSGNNNIFHGGVRVYGAIANISGGWLFKSDIKSIKYEVDEINANGEVINKNIKTGDIDYFSSLGKIGFNLAINTTEIKGLKLDNNVFNQKDTSLNTSYNIRFIAIEKSGNKTLLNTQNFRMLEDNLSTLLSDKDSELIENKNNTYLNKRVLELEIINENKAEPNNDYLSIIINRKTYNINSKNLPDNVSITKNKNKYTLEFFQGNFDIELNYKNPFQREIDNQEIFSNIKTSKELINNKFSVEAEEPIFSVKLQVGNEIKEFSTENPVREELKYINKDPELIESKILNEVNNDITFKYIYSENFDDPEGSIKFRLRWRPYEFSDVMPKAPLEKEKVLFIAAIDKFQNVSVLRTVQVFKDQRNPEISFTSRPLINDNNYITNYMLSLIATDRPESLGLKESGIKDIFYDVKIKDNTGNEVISKKEQLISNKSQNYSKTIKLDFDINDIEEVNRIKYGEMEIYFYTKDQAGNISIPLTRTFKFDTLGPKIDIEYINDSINPFIENYYGGPRTAEVTLTDENPNFSIDDFIKSVVITEGSGVIFPTRLDSSKYVTHLESNGNVHKFKIEIKDSGDYSLRFNYKDEAGNSILPFFEKTDDYIREKSTYIKKQNPFDFTIDLAMPSGTVVESDNTWDSLKEIITFGLFKKSTVKFEAFPDRKGLKTPKVSYYIAKNDDAKALTIANLEQLEFTVGSVVEISDDGAYIVYFKFEDLFGRKTYINSDGVVIDQQPGELTTNLVNEGNINNDTKNVEIKYALEDLDFSSGIKKIEYKILTGDHTEENPLNHTIIYENKKTSYDNYEELKNIENRFKEGSISINTNEFNRSDIIVKINAYDYAGNLSTAQIPLDIDTTKPIVDISYSKDNKFEQTNIYIKERKATIKIKERSNHFDEKVALDSINIELKDYNGNIIDFDKSNIGKWTTVKGKTPDEDLHILDIYFIQDGHYKISIDYQDTHGNISDGIVSVPEQNPFDFKIDLTNPQIEMKYTSNGKQYTVTNDTKNSDIIFSKNIVKLDSARHTNVEDNNIIYKYYYSDTLLTSKQLKLIYDQNDGRMKDDLNEVIIPLNNKGYIYFFAIDNVGKYSSIRTDLIYVDDVKPEIIFESYPEGNENGIITTDPKIIVSIKDRKKSSNEKYSGLSKVYYNLYIDNKITESNVEVANYDVNDILYESRETIKLDLTGVESNNIKLEVFAIDNAGNISDNKVALFAKSSKKPKADIRFNDKYTNYELGEAYYNKERNLEITLFDNDFTFDQDALVNGLIIKYKNVEGQLKTVPKENIKITEIAKNYQIVKVKLSEQGNYTINMSYTNKADNVLEDFETFNTKDNNKSTYIFDEHPFNFTIDLDKPTGKIAIRTNPLDEFIEFITLGIISSKNVDIKAINVKDMTDVRIQYYIDDNFTKYKTNEELDKIKFNSGNLVTLGNNSKSVVYYKLTDKVGRVTYLSSNPVIHDSKKPEITITDPGKQIYNGDVKINIKANDPHLSSGIKKLEYYIINSNIDLKDAKPVVLFEKNLEKITDYSDLTSSISKDIVIDSKLHNRSDIKLVIKVVDNAGNTNTITKAYDIDTTKPSISVVYDNNNSYNNSKYFSKSRKATIKIQERSNHFDNTVAKNNIKITAVDSRGNNVDISNIIGEWTSKKGLTPDQDTHTIEVNFNVDANYKLFISYSDKAGNRADNPNVIGQNNPFDFTVDTIKPTATMTTVTDEGNRQVWDKKIDDAFFGIWSKSGINTTSSSSDLTSGIKSIEYLVSNSTRTLSNQELMSSREWNPYNGLIRFSNDQKLIIYLRVTDRSGNYTLISTDGMIVDKTSPRIEGISPEIRISPQKPINGIYNDDVRVDISVLDPIVSNSSTGLKNVSYRVFNNGKVTQEGTLFNFTNPKPKYSDLLNVFNSYIIVNSKLNNSNNVEIEVFTTDNATNSARKSEKIKIDVTKPTVIVSYDNNTNYNSKYYNKPRVATVRILERNFDPKNVKININNQYGPIPSVSSWSSSGDNGDNTANVARIYYYADGDYKFDLDFTDNAGNKMNPIVYENGTTNADSFIVDVTNPIVNISYNNNDGIAGFFNSPRKATINIVERNFNRDNVQITIKSTLDGKTIKNPDIVWSSQGTSHFATVLFNNDGDYSLEVKVIDLASNKNGDINYGKSSSPKNFTIDQQIDYLSITGITNNGQYNGEILPIINMSDVNLAGYDIKLYRTNKSGIGEDVTEQYVKNIDKSKKSIGVEIDTIIKSITNEGRYKLIATIRDKAGNTQTKTINFIINRYGSIYEISPYLSELNKNYTQSIENDLIINESNLSKLDKGSIKLTITRDGQILENVDYKIIESVGKDGYHNYKYVIDKNSLKGDGVYRIFLVSKDTAGNLKENIDRESMVEFVVDSTSPELVFVEGMENGFVNSKKLPINFKAFDALGIDSIEIYVDGKLVDKIEKFDNINEYFGDIELSEGIRQNVRYLIKDKAGNVLDTNYKNNEGEFVFEPSYAFKREITVSTNIFVRWFENKPVFWATIGGFLFLILLLLLLKRKKNKEVNEAPEK